MRPSLLSCGSTTSPSFHAEPYTHDGADSGSSPSRYPGPDRATWLAGPETSQATSAPPSNSALPINAIWAIGRVTDLHADNRIPDRSNGDSDIVTPPTIRFYAQTLAGAPTKITTTRINRMF